MKFAAKVLDTTFIRILLILLLAMLLFACKTQKVIEHTKLDVTNTTKSDINTQSETHSSSVDTSKNVSNTITSDSTNVVKTEVELSKPDSCGNQYPTRITVTETKSGKQVTNNTIHSNNKVQVADSSNSKTEKSVADSSSKFEQDKSATTKKKTPAWIILSACILSLGLVFLVYRILKRFMIVNRIKQ